MSCIHYIVVGRTDINIVRGYAPLQHVSVSGFLRDTVAEYTLVQTYVNPLKDEVIEAAYTFPLYEGVAVSGFEAEVDGRRIVGRVQEKVAARKEYDEAVKEGKVASLLEQERPDVFQASIGNIPPAKTISIRITLVSEIKQDADQNQVRFVLPTSIAPRYGSAPPVVSSTVSSSASKLSVDISCAMAKQITSIQSPSHTIQVHLGTSPTRVSLTADSLLDRDLVIVVQALELDAPRAFVEHHPTDGTHAVSLTFSPRFALNALKSSELIFLVDRSGSMHGSQIEQAGEALELFLRSIPSDDHYINIIGFGSTHRALFPKSVDYSADSFNASTKYAQALRADMGGTEIMSAFQEVFQRRRHDVPTQIFLLTDGQIWDVDTLVQCIKQAVEEGEKKNSFVRVFSLGVGASVSHHLIESVARAGGGYAQLVVEGERMEKKVVNMLKAALMPPVTNVGVQWTTAEDAHVEDDDEEDFEMVEAGGEHSQPVVDPKETIKEPINLFSTAPEVPSPPPPPPSVLPDVVIPIHQAPFKVPALYRGARFTIYAILSSETPVPKELILRGSSPDGPVELKVNVESVQEGKTMLHSLAARTLVRDLEEGASCIHAFREGSTSVTNEQMLKRLGVHVVKEGKKYKSLPLSDKVVSKLAKQKILELALKYHLSTKYTSWVAIDTESDQTIIHNTVVTSDAMCLQSAPTANKGPSPFGSSQAMPAPTANMGSSVFGSFRAMPAPRSNVASSLFGSSQAMPAPTADKGTSLFGSSQAMPAPTANMGPSLFGSSQAMPAPTANMGSSFFGSFQAMPAPPSNVTSSLFGSSQAMPAPPANVGSSLFGNSQAMPAPPANVGSSLFGSLAQGGSSPGLLMKCRRRPHKKSMTSGEESECEKSPDAHARLHSLLQHQQFDGLFPLEPEMAALLSTTVQELKAKLGELRKDHDSDGTLQLADPEWESVWATCLAVEFLRKQLPDLQEEWELVVEKAEKRMAALMKSAQGVVTAIQQAASEVVKTDKA